MDEFDLPPEARGPRTGDGPWDVEVFRPRPESDLPDARLAKDIEDFLNDTAQYALHSITARHDGSVLVVGKRYGRRVD